MTDTERPPITLTGTHGGHTPEDRRTHIEMRHDVPILNEALASIDTNDAGDFFDWPDDDLTLEQPVPADPTVQAAPEPQPEQKSPADDPQQAPAEPEAPKA